MSRIVCPRCTLPLPEKYDRGPGLRCKCWMHGPAVRGWLLGAAD